eukprot:scaffold13288_cov47-Cyclotella_meneghiniana.AAC.4
MKLTFAFVAAVVSSVYFAPVAASKAFSEIVEDIQDKIHLDKKDVTMKPNLRQYDSPWGDDVDTCLPVGYDLKEFKSVIADIKEACDLCCSKNCSSYYVYYRKDNYGIEAEGWSCL